MIGSNDKELNQKEMENTNSVDETELDEIEKTSAKQEELSSPKSSEPIKKSENIFESFDESDLIIGASENVIQPEKFKNFKDHVVEPEEDSLLQLNDERNNVKEHKVEAPKPAELELNKKESGNFDLENSVEGSSTLKPKSLDQKDPFVMDKTIQLKQDKNPGSYPNGIKKNNFIDDKILHGLSIEYGKLRSAIIKEIKGEKVLITAHKLDDDNPELNTKSSPEKFNEVVNHYFHDLRLKLSSDHQVKKKILDKIGNRSSLSICISGFSMATKTISIPQAGNAKTDEIIDWALKNNLPFQSTDLAFSKSEKQNNDSLIAASGDKNDIESTGDLFKKLNFSVQQFAPEQIAIFNAFKWNYQNLSRQSTIIFHLGERYSYLLVCKGNCLLQAEPILLGIQDLLQTEQNLEEVKKFWHDRSSYQIPSTLLASIGINKPSGLFDVEHRQVIEKWQQSFNRALAGIRRNQPLDEQTTLLLSGSFCEIKYSDVYFGTALGFECEFFNPFKNVRFLSEQDKNIIGFKFPTYTVPVGMALSEKNNVNLLPNYYKNNEMFRFINKLLIPISAGLIVLLFCFSGYTYASYSSMITEVPKLKAEKKSLEYFQKQYQKVAEKKKLINSQLDKMKYDQEYTVATTNLMKFLSSITPNEIELQKIAFHYGYEVSESKRAHGRIFRSTNTVNSENRYASIEGRVNSNNQLMQQYFNFFRDKLESSKMFYSIDVVDASVKAGEGKLTFFIRCEF